MIVEEFILTEEEDGWIGIKVEVFMSSFLGLYVEQHFMIHIIDLQG